MRATCLISISRGFSKIWRFRITIGRSSWREDFRVKAHAPWRPSRSREPYSNRNADKRGFEDADLGINIHWSREECEGVVDVECFAHIKGFAGLDADQRSEISHSIFDLT